MVPYAILAFLVAALFGAYFAYRHLSGNPPSPRWALLHGLIAFTGIGLLIAAAARYELTGNEAVAMTLFLLVALIGGLLVSLHILKQPLPRWLVLVHGSTAVSAFVLLVFAHLRIV